jgi:hypothetical protein
MFIDSIRNYAEGLEQKYEIENIVDIANRFITIGGRAEQGISAVYGKVRKGQKWFSNDVKDNEIIWLLDKIERNGKEMELTFIPEPEDGEVQTKKEKLDQMTKDFVKSMKLNKIELEDIAFKILRHVFTTRQLNKILASDDVEFIMDENWAYIKVDNKAYRV